ncbi:hypothetical protein [Nostoc sp.]
MTIWHNRIAQNSATKFWGTILSAMSTTGYAYAILRRLASQWANIY